MAISREAYSVLETIVGPENVSDDPSTIPRTVRFALTDGDGGASNIEMETINVAAVNDDPNITSSSTCNVPENTTSVLTVTATDPESDPVSFSITGAADSGRFLINGTTGELTFNTAPNFENPTDVGTNNVYEVQVTADDGVPAPEVFAHIGKVHRATLALADARCLAGHLGHQRIHVEATGDSLSVVTVGGDNVIVLGQRADRADANGLLPDVQVTESPDLSLLVCARGRFFEPTDHQHLPVQIDEDFLVEIGCDGWGTHGFVPGRRLHCSSESTAIPGGSPGWSG